MINCKLCVWYLIMCRWMWKFNEPNEHWALNIEHILCSRCRCLCYIIIIILKSNIIRTDYPATGVISFGFGLNLVRFYGEIYSIFMQTEHTLFAYYEQSANYKCTQWPNHCHSSFELPIQMKFACSHAQISPQRWW